MPHPIYFDHNATSIPSRSHLDLVTEVYLKHAGNPSSPHAFGRAASVALSDARHALATSLGLKVSDFVFVSGASEANNLGTRGVLEHLCFPHFEKELKLSEVVISSVEHSSILEPLEFLEASYGLKIHKVPVSQQGVVDVKDFIKSLSPKTKLISLMVANNEIGSLQPVKLLATWLNYKRWSKTQNDPLLEDLSMSLSPEVTKEHLQNLHFHVDAVQAYGKLPTHEWFAEGIDSFSISPHKIGALGGIGALYLQKGRKFVPLIMGGGQEKKRRSGTENLFGIISFGLKAQEIQTQEWWKGVENLRHLMASFYKTLEPYSFIEINSSLKGLPNTFHFSLKPNAPFSGEDLLVNLDMQGVYASSGSACTSGANRSSRIIESLSKKDASYLAKNSIRFSLSLQNTKEDILEAERVLKTLLG
jgi:cysteine desulfurase